jgi:hypothetical protein
VSGGIAQLFLNLGTRRGCVVNATPRPPLPHWKDPVPIVQEAGWAPEPVWIGAENLAPPGFDPRTFQPVASRYPSSTLFRERKMPSPSYSLQGFRALLPVPVPLREGEVFLGVVLGFVSHMVDI